MLGDTRFFLIFFDTMSRLLKISTVLPGLVHILIFFFFFFHKHGRKFVWDAEPADPESPHPP